MRDPFYYLRIVIASAFLLWAGYLQAEIQMAHSGPGQWRIVYEAAETNSPLQVERQVLVGIPLEGEVQLEVVEARISGQLGEEAVDELAEDVRLEGPAYLGEIGFARNQRVVPVIFAPRREVADRVFTYDRVVVDLYFTGNLNSGGIQASQRWAEGYYRSLLLNYEQARKWRRTSVRQAAKTSLQQVGQRVRISVRDQGMYRITGRDLESLGIDLEEVDPDRMRFLYGGGQTLSLIGLQSGLALKEIGGIVEDGGDGRFEREDFVLFYGEPVARWVYDERKRQYVFHKNLYTHENAYWLEINAPEPGRRAAVRSGALQASDPQVPQSYRERIHQESEEFILLQTYGMNSGYEWYWIDFQGNARNFSITVEDAVAEPVDIRMGLFGWTDVTHRFTVKWNDQLVKQISFQGVNYWKPVLRAANGAREGLNQLGLVHEDGRLIRFDWLELEYSRGFSGVRGELVFDSPVSEGVAEFQLKGFAEEQPRIFEVSADLAEIKDFVYEAAAGTAVFQDEGRAIPRRYIVAGPSRWKRPVAMELDHRGGLQAAGRGAEYLIVTHRDFAAAAQRLAAWRAQDDRFGPPLRTAVVDVQDIYDEFSGGVLDPAALRNFLHYAANNWTPAPLFVVLFGDGSYDYKNNAGTSPGNWIPPYQHGESTYDEWYVRVIGKDELPDMAIGRLTVQTAAEAEVVVDKLIDYDRFPESGPWQSRVLLVADDLVNPSDVTQVEFFFLSDSEYLAYKFFPAGLDLIKHYIADYPLEGRTKPQARDEFIRLFNEGALILTYVGHGNPETLAHEQMFVLSRDADSIANGRRLPFMYTAASQVGVFDDPVRTSMPEALLKKADGGVIGMISATRVGYHTSNMVLARAFHGQMYRSEQEHVPLGLALMQAKQLVHGNLTERGKINVRRYSLIGDPATRLAAPRYKVDLEVPDTLRALDEIKVRGQVRTAGGELATNYKGQAWVQAFDSSVGSKLQNMSYIQMGGALFRGLFPVQDGRFEAAFRVPKDITYRGYNGRVSAYLWSADRPAAFGSVEGLDLAGTAAGVKPDKQGPQIDIAFAGVEDFKSGGFVPSQPLLRASMRDESGINITGETGHEITLHIGETVYKVTDFYHSTGGHYSEGVLEYSLPALEPGRHMLALKAWDNFNNSARVEFEVQVGTKELLLLGDVLFYPNPMPAEGGHFTYNLLTSARAVQIQVFSLGGRLIDELEGPAELGYNQVPWQPATALANGVYLYRVKMHGEEGQSVEETAVLQVLK